MATLKQIQETLDQNSGAQFLYQPTIDRALFEGVRKYTPTRRLFPRRTWNTPKYIFNKRTGYPKAQFTTEAPPTSGTGSVGATSSIYSQVEFRIKPWQVQLDLSRFSIQVSQLNGNLLALELDGASKSAVYLEESANLYGSAGATVNTKRQSWDGIDLLMSINNKFRVNGTPSIALLDAMIDSVKSRRAETIGSNYAFVLSPEMLSAQGRLFTQYERFMGTMTIFPRDDRGQLGMPVSDNRMGIDAGLEVVTYRGVPLVESSFVTSLSQMGTVTASATGSDGNITPGDYRYVVEVVTDYGISLASAEATVTVSSTNHVALSWSAPSILDEDGNTRLNLYYRIFRTEANGAAGTETLYAVVSAYNGSDVAVTGWTDLGNPIDPYAEGSTAYAVTVAEDSGESVPDGVTTPRLNPSGHTQQDIWLLPRDPDTLCVAVVNEMQTTQLALVNARSNQAALTGDQCLAVRGPGFMAKACGVYVS